MFRARIIGGVITYNIPRFQEFCNANEGRWVTIKADKPERSISQLRMYRAWLHNVADHTGNDEEALHEFLLDKCATRVVATIKGKNGKVDFEQTKRTSGGHRLSMSVGEMVEYMDKCAALTGYALPTQEELLAMGYIPN